MSSEATAAAETAAEERKGADLGAEGAATGGATDQDGDFGKTTSGIGGNWKPPEAEAGTNTNEGGGSTEGDDKVSF